MSDETQHFNPPLTTVEITRRKLMWDAESECTCSGCANEFTCLYTWDTYNTKHDESCLADK